jgi:hypothetical protein
MLNRRYALLGWAVWRLANVMAKRRAKAMVSSKPSGRKSIRFAAVVPAAAALAVGVWFVFFRRSAEQDADAELLG